MTDKEEPLKVFYVTIEETVSKQVVVEAKNEEEARYQAIDDCGTVVRVPITTGKTVTAISERERA
jgi:hypothetical protein|tara:strand:- start:1564 stop:1758 length:195 start_codon:yes stop_codon:yes gene_type:complete